jgi:hypothetical protein
LHITTLPVTYRGVFIVCGDLSTMMSTMWAVVRDGRIELSEHVSLPDGARVLVTLVPDEDPAFWMGVSRANLDAIWDNNEDDVYAELLKR